ncbi:unnamed protein product [Strongylus vulgaris]|uniref:Uncharacterized protein n=1 Tax=Strongylus vulgaris TaxID=40348 RepID=A0A3P7JVN4_STRVU|nr:unnamed protein product [Strongylus vulgaris]
MFGFSAPAASTAASTTTSTGLASGSLFSTGATTSASSTTSQPSLTFGATPLTTAAAPLTTASGLGTTTTESSSTDATKLSLKGLLEKEGSVGSACSQLLAALTADTEISFADLSAVSLSVETINLTASALILCRASFDNILILKSEDH